MIGMFNNAASFNQNLGYWNISSVGTMEDMLTQSGLSVINYDSTLIGWEAQNVQSNVKLGGMGLRYCMAQSQRNNLRMSHGWNILFDSMDCTSYVTKVKICPGANVNFTSNISGINYQWQADEGFGFTNVINNGTYTGTQINNLQIKTTPSSFYGYKYRCKVDGVNSNSYALQISNKWTGIANSEWQNPLNWSCGIVPDENTDVVIEAGTVILSTSTTIRSLLINPGVNLTIEATVVLTVTH